MRNWDEQVSVGAAFFCCPLSGNRSAGGKRESMQSSLVMIRRRLRARGLAIAISVAMHIRLDAVADN